MPQSSIKFVEAGPWGRVHKALLMGCLHGGRKMLEGAESSYWRRMFFVFSLHAKGCTCP